MNVHFSYKIAKTADLENLLQQQTEKLSRLLRVFRPELVHLKGTIDGKFATRRLRGVAEPPAALRANGCPGNQRHGTGSRQSSFRELCISS